MVGMDLTGSNLVEMLKNKEPKAISQLYDQYAPALYGAIFRIVKSHAVAELILEQTFLRVLEDIHTVKNSTTLFTTMYGMARVSASEKALITMLDNTEAGTKSDDLMNAASCQELMEGMEAQCGEVVKYLYLEGHSLIQTSQALDMPADKVRTQLRSGLAYIQRKINGDQKIALGAAVIISQLIQF